MHEKDNAIRQDRPRRGRCHPMAASQIDWALWFAVFSPFIGVLLGVLGVFILAH